MFAVGMVCALVSGILAMVLIPKPEDNAIDLTLTPVRQYWKSINHTDAQYMVAWSLICTDRRLQPPRILYFVLAGFLRIIRMLRDMKMYYISRAQCRAACFVSRSDYLSAIWQNNTRKYKRLNSECGQNERDRQRMIFVCKWNKLC